ncbi:tetratricopeptide repeat protein [Mesorhizobium sp.]|uniref:tetratricopeptide repeat protein n=1 Tax=Mesorhizobium sp. TaxID=1871066 RepID=UPI0035637EC6
MASKRDRRLRDWKEIAAFFGRDERTVRRWEQQRGLPVHRISGGARNLVFAYTDELERWLRGGETVLPDDVEPPPDEPVALVRVPPTSASSTRIPAFPRLALLAIGAVALLVLAVAVTVTARGIDAPPARIAYRPDPKVQDLYLDAVYHLGTRQADGFTHAIQLLTEATTLDPNYADAYVKLAEAYNTISQFTLMPANEAYPRALAAARRAITLDPDDAGAYAALAFTTFYWTKDFAKSRQLFERAIQLDPNAAQTHHWYALTLMVMGETETPLREISRAQELNPESRAIVANKALILFYAGRVDDALMILQQLSKAEPNLRSAPEYLATIYLDQGRLTDFLREYRRAAEIAGSSARQAIADAAETGLRQSGGEGLLSAMYTEQIRQYEKNLEPAYKVAGTAAMLGRNDDAIRYLEEAARRKEDDMLGIRIDPLFKGLRADSRYLAIVRREGFVPAATSGA